MFKLEYVDNFAEFYAEAKHYFKDHYKTCEEPRLNNQELSIDISLFQHMIDLGTTNIFVIKEDDESVGYVSVNITPSPIFSSPQAVIDFLYILPEHREKDYAARALEEIQEELKHKRLYDINIILPEKEYASSVAEGLGYTKTSAIYHKYLGD